MPDFLIKHKVVARFFFGWVIMMATMLIFHYMGHPLGTAKAADGVIYGTIFGLPAIAVAFVKWAQRGDE